MSARAGSRRGIDARVADRGEKGELPVARHRELGGGIASAGDVAGDGLVQAVEGALVEAE